MRNCQYPETILSFIKCVIHKFWAPKESNEITIIISPYGETKCFSVNPVREIFTYTIRVNRKSKFVYYIWLSGFSFSEVTCLIFYQQYIDTNVFCVFVFFIPVVDFKLFLVFVAGIFLFFYAKTLSQWVFIFTLLTLWPKWDVGHFWPYCKYFHTIVHFCSCFRFCKQ